MKVLVTGSNGFIGSNLVSKLSEESQFEVIRFTRDSTKEDLRNSISKADFIFHAAGVNRPENDIDFARVNTDLTKLICNEAIKTGRKNTHYRCTLEAFIQSPRTATRGSLQLVGHWAQSKL